MDNLILSVLSSVLVSGLLLSALVFLSKTWIGERMKGEIRTEYATKLETHKTQLKAEYEKAIGYYKAELKAQHDSELERLRADLTISVHEHQIRFTKLHERVADAIAGTYAVIRWYFAAVSDYVKMYSDASDPPLNERREKVDKRRAEFLEYFIPNEIYLPEDVAEEIRELDSELFSIADQFSLFVEHRDYKTKTTEKWDEAIKGIRDKARPLLDNLHKRFQMLLGVGSHI